MKLYIMRLFEVVDHHETVIIDHLPGILTAEAAAGVCHVVDAFSRGHLVGLSELGLILSDRRLLGNLGDVVAQLSESGMSVACDRV